ncbi:hypothetical protein RR46_03542 [Papilio xuthus]|uniref:BZIP domain-containing protein n=1 Tax=Papilio xuthus TaxID=66420 RepID=A0A194QJ44_PAPXU|nr:hypothetical protein RR46_03542 [Papilio xuthus]
MPRKRSNISRRSTRSLAGKLSRQRQKDDLEKLEIEVYEARVRLARMRQKYAEYLASQQQLEDAEQTVTSQEKDNILNTEKHQKELNLSDTSGNS